MRTSLVLTALIAAPLLLVTACGSVTPAKPVKGTVFEMEYEPAKMTQAKTPVKERVCTFKKGKRSCKKVTTGTSVVTTTIKKECYEIDVRMPNGDETEVCDKAAYNVLSPGDTYNSAVDYTKKKAKR